MKKSILYFALLFLISCTEKNTTTGAKTSAEKVVDLQLEYYNKNQLDLFCSTYADDIVLTELTTGEVLVSGKEELYKKYEYRFNVQKVHANIVNRIVMDNVVIDHEEVTGIKENEVVKAVAIYEVEDQLIKKVTFVFE